jgi:hypothetical protein
VKVEMKNGFYHFSNRMSHVTNHFPSHLSSILFTNLPLNFYDTNMWVSQIKWWIYTSIVSRWVKDDM